MSRVRHTALRAGAGARRVTVTIVGTLLLCVGIVLLVIPGPGLLLIAAGLAVLATEYAWARNLLNAVRARLRRRRGTATT